MIGKYKGCQEADALYLTYGAVRRCTGEMRGESN